jgi:hypothetical protein
MNFNWHTIIAINNSQQEGFEELVCQLAAQYDIKSQGDFVRVGKPDGGKECLWRLSNGDQIAWQAKFFTSSPSIGQWAQIDASITECIRHHKKLKTIVLALPVDLPDAVIKGRQSALSKWNEKVKTWKAYARTRKQKIEFEYWGNSKLIGYLTSSGNEGLKRFFFNSEEFTDAWFDAKNRESQTALGSRYTKEFSLELPIVKYFSAISRDSHLQAKMHEYYDAYSEKFRSVRIDKKNPAVATLWQNPEQLNRDFKKLFESIQWVSNEPIPVEEMSNHMETLLKDAEHLRNVYYKLQAQESKDSKFQYEHYNLPYSNEIAAIRELISEAQQFQYIIDGSLLTLANTPFLLLEGDAGTGKSHLLADVVNNRKDEGRISLHLLGENFSSNYLPWTQILTNQVRKSNIDEFSFLGALNAKAQVNQSRIIIFIDAINEGEGRVVWPGHLKAFIDSIKNYKWLGLVLSIRSSFVPVIASVKDIDASVITRIEHDGFKGLEHEAAVKFFNHYSIELPDTPILNPEFQNPLFLKMYCEALSKRGMHKTPEGYEGLTAIFRYFIESIDKKLSLPSSLYYDERKQLVLNSIKKVTQKLGERGQDYLDYEEASQIVDEVFNAHCINPEPYLLKLISEGVFNEDIRWEAGHSHKPIISFSYQRFQDHLIIESLLDQGFDQEHPGKIFETGLLKTIFQSEEDASYYENYLEALSVQVPERTNKELFEIVPHAKLYRPLADAFIKSLVWRKATSFSDGSKRFLADVIFKKRGHIHKFLGVSISLSTRPQYFFNADKIHQMLDSLSLAKRDDLWTTFIHDKYGEKAGSNSVMTLVNWAWNSDDKSHLSETAFKLALTMLAWFLTSANRKLRDGTTKALICLLEQRMDLAVELLTKFNNVNDPYVKERVYAAVYGAVVRRNSIEYMEDISNAVHQLFFTQSEVYADILTRDYARSIVEFAALQGVSIPFDIASIRPPYSSKPLPKKLPTKADINQQFKPKGTSGHYGEENWGVTAILESMNPGPGLGGYGDFGRYVMDRALRDFKVDVSGLSRYGIQRIFELGYDAAMFTKFDLTQGSGRATSGGERIGKKYQWIVLHEILARVADANEVADESDFQGKASRAYRGPWYPNLRDIDPTFVIKQTGKQKRQDFTSSQWWQIPNYQNFKGTENQWILNDKDLPSIPKMLELKDTNGKDWLYLEIHPEWMEAPKLGEDKWSYSRKRLWLQVRSLLIHKNDLSRVKKAHNDIFFRGTFPETRSRYEIFSREYYWSEAFRFFNKPYYRGEGWIELYEDRHRGNKVADVMRTAEHFNWEDEFDESKEETITFYKPSAFLFEQLHMSFSTNEGEFVDQQGQLICFDPSVNNGAVSGLLVRKDALTEFLDKNDLSLIWNVVGEKQILGNSRGTEYPGRLNSSGFYELKKGKVVGELISAPEGKTKRAARKRSKTVIKKSKPGINRK